MQRQRKDSTPESAEEILAEVFLARPSVVADMILGRLEDMKPGSRAGAALLGQGCGLPCSLPGEMGPRQISRA